MRRNFVGSDPTYASANQIEDTPQNNEPVRLFGVRRPDFANQLPSVRRSMRLLDGIICCASSMCYTRSLNAFHDNFSSSHFQFDVWQTVSIKGSNFNSCFQYTRFAIFVRPCGLWEIWNITIYTLLMALWAEKYMRNMIAFVSRASGR